LPDGGMAVAPLISFAIRDSGLGASATFHLNGQQILMNNDGGQWRYGK